MKHQFIIFVIVYYMCTEVDGRYVQQHETNRKISDNIERKHPSHSPERHSRNRRQSYFSNDPDYMRLYRNNRLDDYLTDMTFSIRDIAASLNHLTRNNQYNPFNYDRREYSCNCDESIRKLLSIVEELASRAKNPPSPPPPPSIQVVYIPYPVTENIKEKPKQNITIKPRIDVDDPNMIWMNSPRKVVDESEEEDDGSRPVLFKPIASKKSVVTSSPFEKRSYEEEIQRTTSKPLENDPCEGAILHCCGMQNDELKKCFANYNCSNTFNTRKACNPQNVNMVLEKISSMYGPVNES
ncbi:uncharacterized protein LOC116778673 [Danaus plexippus]|uniref:uncharacterized protein LOC116778673 n=1 Tax=Danaus plexippus TaxID=13037 RepID=UPI002AB04D89|nr:uncharacterized protein LOC116778673 [Danaus plexippus]